MLPVFEDFLYNLGEEYHEFARMHKVPETLEFLDSRGISVPVHIMQALDEDRRRIRSPEHVRRQMRYLEQLQAGDEIVFFDD